ncbi:MAG: hypothetical protein ACKVPY_00780 [Paracoccaceae bacterium]
MRAGWFVVVAAVLASAAAYAQNLAGVYDVQGTNPDGSPYSGEARITPTSDTTCIIEWTTGETTSIGICMRSGDVFAASYVLGSDSGLVVYRMKPDRSLDGVWTVANQPGNGTEVLTPK